MTKESLFETLGDINNNYVNSTGKKKSAKPFRWKRWAAAAACLVIAAIFVFEVFTTGERIPLSASTGVTVRYVDLVPNVVSSKGELVYLTEGELFHHPRWELSAFRGAATQIDNIVLDFDGDTAYRAIAQIEVSRVYQGDMAAGDTVSVLLPYAVGTGTWAEDTDVSGAMRAGMEGIFIPIAYAEDAAWQQNNGTLYLRDLAPYGLADGHRWVFLETGSGLLYAREAYPGADGAATLDDIEAYVVGMLKK